MNRADLRQLLEKEIPVLTIEIQELYSKLDLQLGLAGAKLPISFNYEEETLGHYMPESSEENEHFEFSLYFIGYCLKDQISREDRENLYKHEYAHYMAHHLDIPKEYLWQPGPHGSAWKYCCALIKARPSKYFKPDENLSADYESHLKKPVVDHRAVQLADTYRRSRAAQAARDRQVAYQVGDDVNHPKFGQGKVESVEQTAGSVRLGIQFASGYKEIDQKWLSKTGYRRAGDK